MPPALKRAAAALGVTAVAIGATACDPGDIGPSAAERACAEVLCAQPTAEHVSMPCPGSPAVAALVAIAQTDTSARVRSDTQLASGLLSTRLAPGSAISITAPLTTGTHGQLLSVAVPTTGPIWSVPDPPGAPNGQASDRRALEVDEIREARAAACAAARDSAMASASDAIAEARARLASAQGLDTTAPERATTLGDVLSAADQWFALHEASAHEGVITGLRLDTPLPPSGFYPRLENSRWVIVTRPTANRGADRLRQDRLEGYLLAEGVARVTFIREGYASPTVITDALHP